MKAWQYLWFYLLVSFVFSLLKMSDIETYGSDNLRVDCLNDERGKKGKTDFLICKTFGHFFMQYIKVCLSGTILKLRF